MKVEGFWRLVSCHEAICADLGRPRSQLSVARLFALAVVCAAGEAIKDDVQAAARRLLSEVWIAELARLRHSRRSAEVLRDLWRLGLLTRVEASMPGSHVYHPTPRARRCVGVRLRLASLAPGPGAHEARPGAQRVPARDSALRTMSTNALR